MGRRWLASLLIGLMALVNGCGYEQQVTRVETPAGTVKTPDTGRYGKLRLVWVREFHKPKGLSAFPDGGKARETAMFGVLYQSDGTTERAVGQMNLSPVRTADFGNILKFETVWKDGDILAYRVEHGYLGSQVKVAEGELKVPPLQ